MFKAEENDKARMWKKDILAKAAK